MNQEKLINGRHTNFAAENVPSIFFFGRHRFYSYFGASALPFPVDPQK